ncbi:MAG: hypothetical protein SF187_03070 [Deltaproteobacteria bacterium]|nr:hypothetical protein [Deltaproteobacteria bacterium]
MKAAIICFVLVVGLLSAGHGAVAADKANKSAPGAAKADAKRAEPQAAGADDGGETTKVEGKKAKVLTFGAMDVEGKMRTPQLLFFVGRVKAELDSTSQLKRSFIKELKATSKEKGL